MIKAAQPGSTELTGSDWFLVSLNRMMRAAGQAEHIGLTALKLGSVPDVESLRSAAKRLADASPLAVGRLRRAWFGVPRWYWHSGGFVQFPVCEHPHGTSWEVVACHRLNGNVPAPVSFDVVPGDREAILLLQWRHTLLDGKGAELFLAEIARLAADSNAEAHPESWGLLATEPRRLGAVLQEAERFKIHYYALAAQKIRSLGDTDPHAGGARFHVELFGADETEQILQRAANLSQGLFLAGWLLAVSMRAHRRVLAARGDVTESFQASYAVQERKRGARHPIWQNHVFHLFFGLRWAQLDDLSQAAQALQGQFVEMSRQRLNLAFAMMARLFRYIPSWYWTRLLRKSTGGHITSFFFSYTGDCLPQDSSFCGAPIQQGWHIPSVSQPPGTGIFFGQHAGRLIVTFSWRDGVLREGELDLMRAQLRSDLLGT